MVGNDRGRPTADRRWGVRGCWLFLVLALLVGCGDAPAEERRPTADRRPPTAAVTVTAAPPATATAEPTPTSAPPTLTAIPAAAATPLPTAILSPTATPRTPLSPAIRGRLGVQIHLHDEALPAIMAHLEALDVAWVKVQVSWKQYQPDPDRFDDVRFAELDALVGEASARGIQVMLGVAKAPEWSRPTTEMDGPPTDFTLFTAFMETLATRYRGQIAAYELWNEPNLRREWNGVELSAAALVALIRAGAAGVRAVDDRAVLIAGAPAPTGIDDGVNAVDDRRYLAGMLAAGVTGIVDAVGVHPYGWANPPGATVANPDPAAPTHADHRSFFFLDTLRDYRALLVEAGAPEMPLWATEFGWGTFQDLDGSPPPGAEFMNAVSLEQQARYLRDALEIAASEPHVGPLIIWNLNFAPTFGAAFAESGYSLLDGAGNPRPAYRALQPVE